jgi:pimeloyl-ACP methyl ester carboxylesterase
MQHARTPAFKRLFVIGLSSAILFAVVLISLPQPAWPAAGAGAENHIAARTQFVRNPVFQGKMYLEQWGDDSKPSIILIHGLGDNGATDWRYLAPLLARSFHVIAFDLPGFGRSAKFNELYSPDNYARLVDWLAATYAQKPFILIGHSMGGVIALAYATTHPHNLKQLVLIDAAGILHPASFSKSLIDNYKPTWWSHLIPDTAQLNRLLGFGIEDFYGVPEAIDLVLSTGFTRRTFLGEDPAKIAGLAMVQKDFSGLLDQVTMPTLIVWGADDDIAPLRTGKMLAALLPHARLEIIPESKHVPMLDATAELNNIIWNTLTNPQTLAASAKHGDYGDSYTKEERCDRQTERYYSGRYDRLIINACRHITIENAKINHLQITNSSVTIYNSEIGGGAKALEASASTVFATATRFYGDIPVYADGSRLDFAGVTITARKQAFESKSPFYVTFSLCSVTSPQFSGYRHGVYRISPDEQANQ